MQPAAEVQPPIVLAPKQIVCAIPALAIGEGFTFTINESILKHTPVIAFT